MPFEDRRPFIERVTKERGATASGILANDIKDEYAKQKREDADRAVG